MGFEQVSIGAIPSLNFALSVHFCYRLSGHQLKSQFERKGTVAKCATVPDIALCGLRSLCDCCPKHDFLAIACQKIANPVFTCRPTIAFDAVCKICNDFLSIGF